MLCGDTETSAALRHEVPIKPGLCDRTVGGVRYEDLLLVTDDGCETLTGFGYWLDPRERKRPVAA